MKRLITIAILCVGCAAVNAQTFTQRLQKSNAGEGKVTVKQSKEIDDLVNGPQDVVTPVKQTTQSSQSSQTTPKTPNNLTTPITQKQDDKQTDERPQRPQITPQPEIDVDTTSIR